MALATTRLTSPLDVWPWTWHMLLFLCIKVYLRLGPRLHPFRWTLLLPAVPLMVRTISLFPVVTAQK